jgi:hypothetical protein
MKYIHSNRNRTEKRCTVTLNVKKIVFHANDKFLEPAELEPHGGKQARVCSLRQQQMFVYKRRAGLEQGSRKVRPKMQGCSCVPLALVCVSGVLASLPLRKYSASAEHNTWHVTLCSQTVAELVFGFWHRKPNRRGGGGGCSSQHTSI